MTSEKPIEGEKGAVQKPMFEVETMQRPYMVALEIYTSNHRQKRIGQILVDEIELRSWRTGLPHDEKS